MHDLTPITALGSSAPRIETVRDVTLAEVPNLALASVAARKGHEATCAEQLKALIGKDAPEPGKTAVGAPYVAVWMGPQQWMLSAEFGTHEDIAEQVKSHVSDTASVTEQSDAWVCFDLSGTGVFSVVELLCNVNLLAFGAGDATRTSIHHLGCFVICTVPDQAVRILGPRASAGSLHHAITTAMRSTL